MEHRIREAKGTILIYRGEPICYNILNTFAEQLGEALQRLGEEVEYFDAKLLWQLMQEKHIRR